MASRNKPCVIVLRWRRDGCDDIDAEQRSEPATHVIEDEIWDTLDDTKHPFVSLDGANLIGQDEPARLGLGWQRDVESPGSASGTDRTNNGSSRPLMIA
jgi:hypothetical protein